MWERAAIDAGVLIAGIGMIRLMLNGKVDKEVCEVRQESIQEMKDDLKDTKQGVEDIKIHLAKKNGGEL